MGRGAPEPARMGEVSTTTLVTRRRIRRACTLRKSVNEMNVTAILVLL
jgi:hypothetical protein